jgi:hypothetical protein
MRKLLTLVALLLGAIILCGRVLPACAADEAPPAAADATKPDASKAEGGGKEGGKEGDKEGDKAEGGKKKSSGDVSGMR